MTFGELALLSESTQSAAITTRSEVRVKFRVRVHTE